MIGRQKRKIRGINGPQSRGKTHIKI